MRHGARRLTYGELEARSGRLAARLRRLGVGPEVRVGVCTGRTIERIVAVVAVLKAGGAFVPFDPDYPRERLEFLIADARVEVLLTERASRIDLPPTVARVLCIDDLDALDGSTASGDCAEISSLEPDNLAYVIYTSGSTGRPKGVAVSHRSLSNLADWAIARYGLTAADEGTQVASPAFDASIFELLPFLAAGAGLAIPDDEVRLSAERTLRWWAESGTTIAFLPTPLAEVLLEEEIPAELDLRLRVLTIGGDRLRRPPLPATPFALSNVYGPAEATVASTEVEVAPVERGVEFGDAYLVGRPIDGLRLHVLGSGGEPAPDGEEGELYVAGVGLARGYLLRPDLTAERFLPDPFDGSGERLYRTGDLGRRRPDGGFDFLGRVDHQVKVLGMRVELGEIESVLAQCPEVRDAVVVAHEGAGGATRLTAFAVARELPADDAVRTRLRESLPRHMVPSALLWLDSLPLTPNGKVDRRALAARAIAAAAAERDAGEGFVAPRTELEKLLASIWSERLGRSGIGVRDDFFRLGGHSLLATQVVSRIRRELGLELGIQDLFAAPTIEALAARLEGAATAAALPLVPLPRHGEIPLSFAQQRLWFLDRLRPGSSLYNMPMAYRLRGDLDAAALQAALGEIVRRHEALRTTFEEGSGGPVQRIAPPLHPFPLPAVDLAFLPEEAREDALRTLLADEGARPFDLRSGPLFRALRIGLGPNESVLLLAMHHVASDGWSMGVLLRELEALYRAAEADLPSPLPEPPLQYADFALWQRRWAEGPEMARQLGYWSERLRGQPPLLGLPADRPRPAVQSHRGASLPLVLDAGLTDRLRAFSRERAEPLFMVLAAAYFALLRRYTGSHDLTVGTPLAGRPALELEGLIGFFVNLLPLRVDAGGDPAFSSWTDRVRAAALGAYAHGEVPFDRLVEELVESRDLGSSPLFQSVLVLQTAPLELPRLPRVEIEPEAIATTSAKFDLTVSLTESAGSLVGEIEYSRDLFDAATVLRLGQHLLRLCAGAVEAPEARLSELPLLAAAEREELLLSGRGAARERPDGLLAHHLVSRHAALRPAAPAVAGEGGGLTYGELERQSNRLAHHLCALGVGPETRVAICAGTTPERAVAVVAVLKAGGSYVSLDPSSPDERLAFLLEDSGSALVLTESSLLDRLPAAGVVRIALDRDRSTWVGSESAPPEVRVDPDHLAYLIYTSGSTGQPKGVAIPHRGLLNLIFASLEDHGLREDDRCTLVAGPAFDASVWELWSALGAGAALLIPDPATRLSAERLLAWWTAERITVAFLPTPLAEAVLAELESDPSAGSGLRLRRLWVGGDRLRRTPPPGLPFILVNHYGPSEVSVVTTRAEVAPLPPGSDATAPVVPSIGRPLANLEVFVLDGNLDLVPAGVQGELYVAGVGVARGYHGRPDLTAERFVPHPWGSGERMYRTGDIVRRRARGDLDFIGRNDGQVKVRGFRIELGEIEALLAAQPAVRAAAVLARTEERGEVRLVAYLAPAAPGSPESEEELRRALGAKLPDYMVPAAFVWLEALPLTANGKVDRQALAVLDLSAVLAASPEREAPRNREEEALAELWSELLGLEISALGVHDDFFRLGGHSLLAVQLLSRIRRSLGVEVELQAFFAAPTLAGLAGRLSAAAPSEAKSSPPTLRRLGRDGRELPLSFAQQRLWFLDRMEPGASTYNLPRAYRLGGRIDPPSLAAALSEVVRRHEALRTRFAARGGEAAYGDGPVQIVEPPSRMPLPVVDLSLLPGEVRRGTAGALVAEAVLRPFDLERGPLLRALLIREADDDWTLLLAMHHIVSDGWSVEILLRELSALYAAALERRPSPLPELPLQYGDYARWQRETLRGPDLERPLDFWRQRLAGHSPVLELPFDRPRPALQTFRGGLEPIALGTELTADLHALGRGRAETLFVTLLGGFAAFLSRYSGATDLIVGTPAAGRSCVEVEGLIGFFVNTLPLRVRAAGDPPVRELLSRVHETVRSAFAHGEVPFERIVEETVGPRDPSYSPLVQVMLGLETESRLPELAGIPAHSLPLSLEAAKFDLTLFLRPSPDGLAGELEYNRDLFDGETVGRMAAHLRTLLAAMVAAPEARLSDLPLLSPRERRQLLDGWNRTAVEYPRDATIPEIFARVARANPQAVALEQGEERLTYSELAAAADRLAVELLEAGLAPGGRVGLYCRRSIPMVVGMLAVLKAGGAYLPLDRNAPAERLRWILDDTDAPLLLAERSLAAELPAGRRAVWLDGGREERSGAGVPASRGADFGGASPAYVIYTSGSTGRPKGVVVPHRGILRLVLGSDYVRLAPGSRIAQASNAAFDAATFEVWGALLNGGTLVILGQDDLLSPAALAGQLRTLQIDTMFLTTALFNQVVRERPDAFAPLATLLFGGEAADPAAVRKALDAGPPARLLNVYGPTENTTFSTWFEIEALPAGAVSVPIGRPIANSRSYLLDGNLEPVPGGVHGSLYVGGDGLASGYLGRPELTAERFVPDPFGAAIGGRLYATGDQVRARLDGSLEFLGRADQQVKLRGFRIELGEIESALTDLPAVSQAAVIVQADPESGGRLVAYLVSAGGELEMGELRAALKARLPDYMVPAQFVVLDRLPLTANGKVDRRALPSPEEGVLLAGALYAPPTTPLETLLAGIWSEVLRVDRVGIHDSFWELGGHSLLATKVLARIRLELDIDLPLRELFKAPTVPQLAQVIGQALLEVEPLPSG